MAAAPTDPTPTAGVPARRTTYRHGWPFRWRWKQRAEMRRRLGRGSRLGVAREMPTLAAPPPGRRVRHVPRLARPAGRATGRAHGGRGEILGVEVLARRERSCGRGAEPEGW